MRCSRKVSTYRQNPPFPDALITGVSELAARMYNPIRFLHPVHRWRFAKAKAFLRAKFEQVIQQHRADAASGVGADRKDLIDLMLAARDDETGAQLSNQDIQSQCLTFFFAGHDTTAHTIAWALFEIAQHPEVEALVLEEVDTVLGDAQAAEYAQLGQLKYITAVLKETLRLHPPVPIFSREAGAELTLGGYKIRKGTVVTVQAHNIHMDEQHWNEPFLFNPQRFMSSSDASPQQQQHAYAWLPFATGERQCIGMNFAMLEMRAVLAALYKQFVFRVDCLRLPRVAGRITQCPADGIHLFIQKRLV
eukprot:TRINITY_DN11308_c0_g1_i1.p1 TRINITY_DN11308_c0_g1~~TRINITY_DN11308_c0_g1_i1.p1  ORF type:complete len:306 (+),score=87.49 TRINITY_DN11308_c0_g1_i1:593-1510(+)